MCALMMTAGMELYLLSFGKHGGVEAAELADEDSECASVPLHKLTIGRRPFKLYRHNRASVFCTRVYRTYVRTLMLCHNTCSTYK